MAYMVGTVKCQCWEVMGMPTIEGECTVEDCYEKKSFWGEETISRMDKWAKEHSEKHT